MARKNWIDIRVKTEAPNLNSVRSKIMGWPEEVAEEYYWPAITSIAAAGRARIKQIVRTAPNRSKEPGRIDTKTMINSVRARVRKRKNGFSAFVGWIDGKPGYAIFQELGTSNGVLPMNAIQQAQEYMLSELRALSHGVYQGSPADFEELDDD